MEYYQLVPHPVYRDDVQASRCFDGYIFPDGPLVGIFYRDQLVAFTTWSQSNRLWIRPGIEVPVFKIRERVKAWFDGVEERSAQARYIAELMSRREK